MKNVNSVVLELTKGGELLVRAKVQLVGSGMSLETTTSNKGVATFFDPKLAGKTVDLHVNGVPVKKDISIPAQTESGVAKAKIETVPVTAAPQGDKHQGAVPPQSVQHHPEGHDEPEGHIIIVRAKSGLEPIHGAVIRVVGEDEVYTTVDGEAVIEYFTKPTRLEISAPKFKTQVILIEPDDEVRKVDMEADVKKAKPVSNTKSMLIVLATLLIAAVGYFVSTGQSQVAQQTLVARTTDATSMIIVGCLIFTFLGVMNRIKNDQIPDIVFAALALVAWIFAPQITSDFWRGLLSGGLLLVAYAFAISNTPDLTIMAVFWKLAAAGVYFFHWRGLLDATIVADELVLFKTLWLIGDAHLVLEVMQVAQRIKGHQMQETMENLSFMLITVVAYAVARYWLGWQAYIALFVAGAIMGLIGELAEERFKNFDESQINTGRTFFDLALKGMAKYAKTQKADGAAVGVSLITNGAIFLGIS